MTYNPFLVRRFDNWSGHGDGNRVSGVPISCTPPAAGGALLSSHWSGAGQLVLPLSSFIHFLSFD